MNWRARAFDALLNGLTQIRSIARANADTIHLINTTRLAVAAQTRRLVGIQARRKRATAAVLVERDEIAQLRLTIVGRELAVAHDQAQKCLRPRGPLTLAERHSSNWPAYRANTAPCGSWSTPIWPIPMSVAGTRVSAPSSLALAIPSSMLSVPKYTSQ